MGFQPFEVRLSAPADDHGARVLVGWQGRNADGALRLSVAERREIAAWFDDAVQRHPAAQRATAEDAGARLFAALLDAAPLRLWNEARATSAALELRLSWQPGDPAVAELAALPWELLYDRERHVFVAVGGRTSIVRRLDGPRASGSAPRRGPLRVLLLDAGGPAADEELRALRRAALDAGAAGLRWAQALGLASIDSRVDPAGTAASLPRELAAFDADVLHLVAHGGWDSARAEGALLLNDGAIGAQAFAALVANRAPAAVVLNTCLGARLPTDERQWSASSVAGALVRHGVPVVVAMQGLIEERAALTFAREFHARLLAGDSAPVATQQARLALRAQAAAPDWALPTVYARADDAPPPRRPPASARTQALTLALDGALAIAVTLLLAFLVPRGLDVVSARDARWAMALGAVGVALAALWCAVSVFARRTRQSPRADLRAATALLGLLATWSCLAFRARAEPVGTTTAGIDAEPRTACPPLAFDARPVPQPAATVADAPIASADVSARFTVSLAAVYILVPRASEASRDLIVVDLELYWPPRSDGLRYQSLSLSARAVPGTEVLDGWPRRKSDPRPLSGALSVVDDERLQPVPDCPATIAARQCTTFFSSRGSGSWRVWLTRDPPGSGCARATLLLRVRPGVKHLNLELRRRVKLADEVFGRAVRRHKLEDAVISLPISLAGR